MTNGLQIGETSIATSPIHSWTNAKSASPEASAFSCPSIPPGDESEHLKQPARVRGAPVGRPCLTQNKIMADISFSIIHGTSSILRQSVPATERRKLGAVLSLPGLGARVPCADRWRCS